MTALSGLMTYLELTQAAGLRSSVERHVRLRERGQGWTDSQIVISLILLNLAGGESVSDLDLLEKVEAGSSQGVHTCSQRRATGSGEGQGRPGGRRPEPFASHRGHSGPRIEYGPGYGCHTGGDAQAAGAPQLRGVQSVPAADHLLGRGRHGSAFGVSGRQRTRGPSPAANVGPQRSEEWLGWGPDAVGAVRRQRRMVGHIGAGLQPELCHQASGVGRTVGGQASESGALRPDRPTGPGDASCQEVDHPCCPWPSLIRVAAQGAAEDIGAGCRAVIEHRRPRLKHRSVCDSYELPGRAMPSSA